MVCTTRKSVSFTPPRGLSLRNNLIFNVLRLQNVRFGKIKTPYKI